MRKQDIPLSDEFWHGGELFRAVPNTQHKLACSSNGTFIGKHRRILTPRKHTGGYVWYSWRLDSGQYRNVYGHRGVALSWLDNPGNKSYVNHLDGDKTNNCIDNLEWVTPAENTRHAIDTGLVSNIPEKGQQGFQRRLNAVS